MFRSQVCTLITPENTHEVCKQSGTRRVWLLTITERRNSKHWNLDHERVKREYARFMDFDAILEKHVGSD